MASALIIISALSLCACGEIEGPAPTINPYEGMLQVPADSDGNMLWVDKYDDLDENTLDASLFRQSGNFLSYSGMDCRALKGIDVSEHQYDIDWEAVKAAGIEFAIIRAGYRGYTEGKLNEDAWFRENVREASDAGLQVGIYFFSQALNDEEAAEEADYLISILEEYKDRISLPVFFDWENIATDEARTEGRLAQGLTSMAISFCKKLQEAGYQAGVYASRTIAYYNYDLEELDDSGIALWINGIGSYPDFYWSHDCWQYSVTGQCDGVD